MSLTPDFIPMQESLSQSSHCHNSCMSNNSMLHESTLSEPSLDESLIPKQTTCEDLRKMYIEYSKNLKICSINVNSIRNKFENVHQILKNVYIDCFFVNESKIDESFPNNQFAVENYTLYRHDRTSHAGGVMGYVRSDIPHTRVTEHELKLDYVESLALKLVINRENWLIISIYRSPCSNENMFIEHLTLTLEQAQSAYKQIILIGDMNFNMLRENKLLEVCDQFSLKNMINDFTCYKNCDNPSLVDVCLLNNPNRFLSSFNLVQEAGFSDFHSLIGIVTRLHCDIFKPRRVVYRCMKHFDPNNFSKELDAAPFHVMSLFDDVDDQAWFFHTLYKSVVDLVAPVKTKTIKSKPLPYMNSALRKAMFRRNMLRNKYYKANNKQDRSKAWEDFRHQRNIVTQLRRTSLKKYFYNKSKQTKTDPKSYYKAISPFITNKSKNQSTDIQLNIDQNLITDPVLVCEKFNCFFDEAVSDMGLNEDLNQEITTIIDHYKDHPSIKLINNEIMKNKTCSFSFNHIHDSILEKAIKALKPNKACGYDKISPAIVKSSNIINKSLIKVYNNSIEQSTFPHCLKPAEISPIFKKGDRLSLKNYRPVNVLSSLSKPFESIISNQISEYFSNNGIINDLISAYRKGFGTNQTLLKMVEDWKSSLDKGENIGVIASDQSKAFDTLPPGLHIAKLNAYGFSLESCKFILNYLRNRPHTTKLGPYNSSWNYQEKGVAQGSGLGPLLYNLHCNDLPYLINSCNFYNYADDNTISFSSKDMTTIDYNLRKEVNTLLTWFRLNGFKANPEKFQFMLISKYVGSTGHKLIINDSITINSDSTMKILGVTFDNKLTFSPHVNEICKKANRSINALKRLTILPQSYKLDIVKTYIKSNFNYCDIVYHFCGKLLADKLEKIQRRALQYAYQDFETSYDILLTRANMREFTHQRIITILKEAYKTFHNLNPTPTRHLFISQNQNHHETRQAHNFTLPTYNTVTYGKRSIKYLGPKLWNLINPSIRIGTFNNFIDYLQNNFVISDNLIISNNLSLY